MYVLRMHVRMYYVSICINVALMYVLRMYACMYVCM